MATAGAHRLPRTVDPDHYQLTFTVGLAAGTFAGEERVRLTVREPIAELVLNAVDLRIQFVELLDADGAARPTAAVEIDRALEQATIRLADPIEPGPYTLHLTFAGLLNERLHGVYRSTYTDDQGAEHTVAATQFEPADARRAFPCWDEPDRKATFATTLVVDEGLNAISNTEAVEVTDLGDGRTQFEFAPTMRMSTYLVAFVVGSLEATEPLDVDGVPLRVVCVPGKQGLAGFATQAAAASLRFFSAYFGIPYPSTKLDLIALPDFAMGAMENLGAVTFRETLLLVDPERATRGELERVADVVAHEIAHMWFGDLVTMRWWNGIWLNEAFATFMEMLCVDAFRPEWERWVTFGTSRDDAMEIDALSTTRPVEFPVERPEEAEGMFDILTYQKGAAVLRMLERYVGEKEFRSGISRYIADHSHGNTDTADLWDAVERATGEPARSIMDSWIFQGGFPLVTASVDPAPGPASTHRLLLAQRRFRYVAGADDASAAGGGWRVPVHVRASVGGRVTQHRILLDAAGASLDLDPAGGGGDLDWVVVNERGWGFYRVAYDGELGRRLTDHLAELDALERLGLASDTWAAVLADQAPPAAFLDLADRLADDGDPSVWKMVLDGLTELDRVAPVEDRARLQAFVRDLAGPALARLGWSARPHDDERAGRLRATLVRALGVLGEEAGVRDLAAETLRRAEADPAAVDNDVLGAVVAVVAAAGGAEEYERFLSRHRDATTPQDELRYLYALAGFTDPDLVGRTVDLALGGEVRAQDAPFLVSLLLANRAGGALAWAGLRDRWDDLAARVPESLHERALGGITALSTPEQAAEVRSFLEAHPLAGRERTVAQILERLDVLVALRRRAAGGLGPWPDRRS